MQEIEELKYKWKEQQYNKRMEKRKPEGNINLNRNIKNYPQFSK